MRRQMTQQEFLLIALPLMADGQTVEKIAEATGYSYGGVVSKLRRLGYECRTERRAQYIPIPKGS